jgi:predicted MFS family arabinose efflux permease
LGAGVGVWFGLRATFVATAFIYLMAGTLAFVGLPKPPARRRPRSQWALPR